MKKWCFLGALLFVFSSAVHAECTNEQLDTFRKLKNYHGWQEARCPRGSATHLVCLRIALSHDKSLKAVESVFPNPLLLETGCRIEFIYWNVGLESGVTFHN